GQGFVFHPFLSELVCVLRGELARRLQFSSSDWQSFLKANNVISSMSRRGNCHDNAVAESFFQLLKRERIRRKIYTTREEARSDIFDYIEMFYNPKRRHSSAMQLSPIEYEKRYFLSLESV
ncbi:IS3 family transposase, partial [Pseudomonas aeruginosa]|uniref:IS3 family transposase n=3 Tax=Pseudomonas aeruginosa TaxID=287 RepID=UPI001F08ECE0